MDSHRPIAWRALLATATVGLAAASFGGACAAQDGRDGTSQGAYEGRYLSWSGKTEPAPRPQASTAPQDEAAPPADEAPPPISSREPAARYAFDHDAAPSHYGPETSQAAAVDTPVPAAQPYRQAAYPGPAPESYRRAAPEAPPPNRYTAPRYARSETPAADATAAEAYRAPASYTPPPPAPEAAPPPAPRADEAPPPATQSELFPDLAPSPEAPPRFARSQTPASDAPPAAEAYRAPASFAPPPTQAPPPAAEPPPPAPPPAAYRQAANTPPQGAVGAAGVHFYSLHRQFGMSPDPIPEATQGHTVLIGPPESASAAEDARQDDDGAANDSQADQDAGGVGQDTSTPAHDQAHHGGKSGGH